MHPKDIKIQDYTYILPKEKIALYPTKVRSQSKLLIYNKGEISETIFEEIYKHIPQNSSLVFNNSKVIPARFYFYKKSGGKIELFFLEPANETGDYSIELQKKEKVVWKCYVGGLNKWKDNDSIYCETEINNTKINAQARLIGKEKDACLIELSWQPHELTLSEIFIALGNTPLPPYINREKSEDDTERYQNVYAEHQGSVAAPTAGLHFDEFVFKELEKKNIKILYTTLHVSAGTFKPVTAHTMSEHDMHNEWMVIKKDFINDWLNNIGNNFFAVGTTSLRNLETTFWIGVKLYHGLIENDKFILNQWEPYENLNSLKTPLNTALEAILNYLNMSNKNEIFVSTSLLISPGYSFNTINGLITNFHQPESTLLLLVSALIKENWRNVYDYALQNNFRFLSFGDSSLLIP